MPQYSIKLCTYDPAIIDAFERLRKNRKQAAFTHEALKYFLLTEKGKQVLMIMEGKTSSKTLAKVHLSNESTSIEEPTKQRMAINETSVIPLSNSSSVLDRILQ